MLCGSIIGFRLAFVMSKTCLPSAALAINMHCWAVRYFKIKELGPKPSKPFFGLREDLRIAFACDVTECHLNAPLHRERVTLRWLDETPGLTGC